MYTQVRYFRLISQTDIKDWLDLVLEPVASGFHWTITGKPGAELGIAELDEVFASRGEACEAIFRGIVDGRWTCQRVVTNVS